LEITINFKLFYYSHEKKLTEKAVAMRKDKKLGKYKELKIRDRRLFPEPEF